MIEKAQSAKLKAQKLKEEKCISVLRFEFYALRLLLRFEFCAFNHDYFN